MFETQICKSKHVFYSQRTNPPPRESLMRLLPMERPHLRPAGLQRLGGWRPEQRLSREGLGTHMLPRTGGGKAVSHLAWPGAERGPDGPLQDRQGESGAGPCASSSSSWVSRALLRQSPPKVPAHQHPSLLVKGVPPRRRSSSRSQQCSQDQGERETGVSQAGRAGPGPARAEQAAL